MVKISGAVKDIYRITYFYELVLKKTFDIFEKVWYSIKVVRNNTYHLCASGSAVEHLLAKEGVAGSIPVSRSFLFLNSKFSSYSE